MKFTPQLSDGCWNWSGHCEKRGYGIIGSSHGNKRAHRVIWETFVGKIPQGLCLDHLCRNTSCVRPSHLQVVTWRENTLRGTNFIAQHVQKTQCKNGHQYSGDNFYILIDKTGFPRRICRICKRINWRKYNPPKGSK